MYQVIIYDNSGQYPRVMHRENFSNEECAWSWYEMKDKEKILSQKQLKLEFKCLGNSISVF